MGSFTLTRSANHESNCDPHANATSTVVYVSTKCAACEEKMMETVTK